MHGDPTQASQKEPSLYPGGGFMDDNYKVLRALVRHAGSWSIYVKFLQRIIQIVDSITTPCTCVSNTSSWWGYQLTKTVSKWRFTANVWNLAYWISDSLLYWDIYLIHIYHMCKCSKCNWNRYIEGFCIWNVHFHINGLSPNIAYVILMSWPLMAIYFLSSNYWLFSCSFHIIFNGNK